jgi:hypothetical protein
VPATTTHPEDAVVDALHIVLELKEVRLWITISPKNAGVLEFNGLVLISVKAVLLLLARLNVQLAIVPLPPARSEVKTIVVDE